MVCINACLVRKLHPSPADATKLEMRSYYLRRRSQGIAAYGFVSGRREVSHDEPQESIFGLLLFLIKPMTRRRMGVAQILFADGTTYLLSDRELFLALHVRGLPCGS